MGSAEAERDFRAKQAKKRTAGADTCGSVVSGRGRRNRTLNQRFWRPLLYQLSYTPVERKTRLELATPTLARWCSTTELFPQLFENNKNYT